MQRSAEVEAFVREMLDVWQSGDTSRMDGLLAQDALVVGTDPNEWWDSREVVERNFRTQLEVTGGFPLEAEDPVGYERGDVGWFALRFRFRFPGMPAIPTRMTGVVVRENGGWRATQMHISVGVSNEEVAGEEVAERVGG